MNKIYLLILLGFISCSASKEILKEEIKIEQKEIEVEGKEYALTDLDFDYDLEEPILVIDTIIAETAPPGTSETKVKVKIQVRKKEKKADIEVVTSPIFIKVADTTTTIVQRPERKSELKFWGYWLLGFLILLAIVLFIWKSK